MPYLAKQKTPKERRVPVQARAIKRVNKILDTTLSLMSNREYDKITTHLIADKAGVSVGSVYQFFPNVESVKIALIERLLDQYYDHFSATIKAHSDINNLSGMNEILVSATHDFYQAHPDVTSHIVASSGSQEFNQVNRRLNDRVHKLLMDYFSRQEFGLDKTILKRKVSVAIATGDMMTMLIWSSETQEERDAYLQDWKDITRFYSSKI